MLSRTLLLLLIGALAAAVAADSTQGNRKRAAFAKGEAVLAVWFPLQAELLQLAKGRPK